MYTKIVLVVVAFICFTANEIEGNPNPHHDENEPSVPSSSGISGRIVGGEVTDIVRFPYQISLSYFNYFKEEREHICGGSVISPNVAVTAAHCTYDLPRPMAETLQVRVGSSSSLSGGKLVQVEKIINHEEYTSWNLFNDISIMVLAETLTFSEFVQQIPITSDIKAPGSVGVVSGWGYLYENSGVPSTELRFVEVPLIDKTQCKNDYYADEELSDSMMCAGVLAGGKDACTTDSGGPLAVDGELVALVSWGTGCARANRPTVYTSVFYMRDWIKKQLKLYSV